MATQQAALTNLAMQSETLAQGIQLQHTSWQEYLDALEPISRELTEGLSNFVAGFGPEIEDVLQKFDEELARAVGRLGTTIGQMSDHSEDFDQRIARLLGSLAQTSRGLEEAAPRIQKELSAAATSTAQAIAAVRQQLLREMERASRTQGPPGGRQVDNVP